MKSGIYKLSDNIALNKEKRSTQKCMTVKVKAKLILIKQQNWHPIWRWKSVCNVSFICCLSTMTLSSVSEYSIKTEPVLHKNYCWKDFDFHLCLWCRDAEIPQHRVWKRAGADSLKAWYFCVSPHGFSLVLHALRHKEGSFPLMSRHRQLQHHQQQITTLLKGPDA